MANSLSPMPSDAAESAPVVPTTSACARNDISPTFETTGIRYSSLEDGVVGRRLQG